MTRTIRTAALFMLATFSLLAHTANATRIIAQDHDAYELRLGEVDLPDNTSGTVIFKACKSCKTQSMRVTNTTVYQVGGRMVTLKDFTEAAEAYRKQGDTSRTMVTLIFHIGSHQVTRLGISNFGQ